MIPIAEQRPVVWLDRDGTVVDDPGYLKDPRALVLLPGAAAAIAALNRAGAMVIMVTNQSGIDRGLMSAEDVQAVHRELGVRLAAEGAHFDDMRICPHLPASLVAADEAPCECRKPRPGLVLQARIDHGIDPKTPQLVVGDKRADLELARALGLPGVLVLTGEGNATRRELRHEDAASPAHVAADLRAALPWILSELGLADAGRR